MFISHLLATREVEADKGTEANEGREVEDKEEVLGHVATRPKTPTKNYKVSPKNMSMISCTILADLYRAVQACRNVQKAQFLSVALPHKMKKQTTKLLVTIKLLLQENQKAGFWFLSPSSRIQLLLLIPQKKQRDKFPGASPRAKSLYPTLCPPRQGDKLVPAEATGEKYPTRIYKLLLLLLLLATS